MGQFVLNDLRDWARGHSARRYPAYHYLSRRRNTENWGWAVVILVRADAAGIGTCVAIEGLISAQCCSGRNGGSLHVGTVATGVAIYPFR